MSQLALLASLLAAPVRAAAAPAPAAAAAAAPAVSSAAAPAPVEASTMTVSSIYTGDRVRDPFSSSSSGGARLAVSDKSGDENAPPDIHAMTLRGIMRDADTDYALFSAESGESFMLRGGKLHNGAGKPVPGVTGRIRPKQKTVELVTADKDVQVYRLGEADEKDKEKDKERKP